MAEATPRPRAQPTGRTSRPYRSPSRANAAAETRTTILTTAMQLFLERGYGRVTVNDIAQQANLASPTIYASTGGKSAILATLIDERQRDDPVIEETLKSIAEARSAREVVTVTAHGTRAANELYHDIVQVMVTAAVIDNAVADILARSDKVYRDALSHTARRLQRLHALKKGVTQRRAIDMLWYLFGHASWHLLVHDQQWSWDEAESFLARQAMTALAG